MSRRKEYDSVEPRDDFQLTVDGKEFGYRDPNKKQTATYYSRGDRQEDNPHAYNMTNPLYDYSYGQVRDAGKALGISNVDEKGEVDKIMDYMQKPRETETAEVEKPKKVKQPKAEKPAAPVEASADVVAAKERSQSWEQGMRGSGEPTPYGGEQEQQSSTPMPYGQKSAFAERSSEVYNPEKFTNAQSFLADRTQRTKKEFNFQPTLK